MIYFRPTIVIRETDARELALLLGGPQHMEVALHQIDDMVCELRRFLVEKTAYIERLKNDPPLPAVAWVPPHKLDTLQAERGFELWIEEQEEAANRYCNAMATLKRIREPLIALTELAWALEDQRGWGLTDTEALRVSQQRAAQEELNQSYEELDPDEAELPPLST